MKVAVHSYHAGKAWLCICVGVEPPFSKSWIRHCEANKKQHACASSGPRDHYSELFTRMAALKF